VRGWGMKGIGCFAAVSFLVLLVFFLFFSSSFPSPSRLASSFYSPSFASSPSLSPFRSSSFLALLLLLLLPLSFLSFVFPLLPLLPLLLLHFFPLHLLLRKQQATTQKPHYSSSSVPPAFPPLPYPPANPTPSPPPGHETRPKILTNNLALSSPSTTTLTVSSVAPYRTTRSWNISNAATITRCVSRKSGLNAIRKRMSTLSREKEAGVVPGGRRV